MPSYSENFKDYFFQITKKFEGKFIEFSRVFYFSKFQISNVINYSTNMCLRFQGNYGTPKKSKKIEVPDHFLCEHNNNNNNSEVSFIFRLPTSYVVSTIKLFFMEGAFSFVLWKELYDTLRIDINNYYVCCW